MVKLCYIKLFAEVNDIMLNIIDPHDGKLPLDGLAVNVRLPTHLKKLSKSNVNYFLQIECVTGKNVVARVITANQKSWQLVV